jgi:hypothetical protein
MTRFYRELHAEYFGKETQAETMKTERAMEIAVSFKNQNKYMGM